VTSLTSFIKGKVLSNKIVLILVLFLIVFPKGGFKINDIPLTWGYLLLSIVSFFCLFKKKYSVAKDNIYVLLSLLPFQLYSLVSITLNGISYIGFAISFFVSFFFLPFIFLFVFSSPIQKLDQEYFFKLLKRSIFFVASYGIFLFFYKIIVGSFFEVPFLTINYHEIGLIETTKCSDRGSLFKLISTYNNGNIYGISILMFLPLYRFLEKSFFKRTIVYLSLILTISRTVWIGLIISEFLYRFFIKKNMIASSIKYLISLIAIISLVIIIFNNMNYPIDWLFDKTLGNRLKEDYFNLKMFSNVPFEAIEEMLYFSILNIFGVIGLILFVIALFSPVYIFILKNLKMVSSQIDKSILSGLITYLIISFADSASLYIPVMAFYWFLSSFLFIDKQVRFTEDLK
jgi:hypothetical protein